MKTPKTISITACKKCGGEFFAGTTKVVLHPGNETTLPDELTIVVRKVSRCTGCMVAEDRTKGSKNRRVHYDR